MANRRDPYTVKKMADLLRAGATLLAERCPVCGLPLFRLRSGEVICSTHGKVYIVKDEAEVSRITVENVLDKLEKIAANQINKYLNEGVSLSDIIKWLEILERIERIRSIMENRHSREREKVKEEKKT